MLTTGYQLKAARALVGWEQSHIAGATGLSINTVRNMEAVGAAPISGRAQNVQSVQRALEDAGVEFLNHGNPGVRLRDFRVGDRVRLRKGTSVWGQHHDLKDQFGTVAALVHDGTSMKRITVAYDGVDMFTGMDANMFEFAN